MTFDEILAVFSGSDADATKALYARLLTFAPRGLVAVNLMRASKASERAKKYRGGTRGGPSYRTLAYDKKDWAIGELCRALVGNPDVAPSWGWGRDENTRGFEDVLYVDIPGAGQVSFHVSYRKDGPDYPGAWDGIKGVGARRIARWVEAILAGREVFVSTSKEESNVARHDRTEGADAAPDAGGQDVQEAFGF